MSNVVKLSDASGYVKTLENKAIINTDTQALASYRAGREQRKKEQDIISRLHDENVELKSLLKNILSCTFNIAALTNTELMEIEKKSRSYI